jgi:hypothetical protein
LRSEKFRLSLWQKVLRYRLEKWGWILFTPIALYLGWLDIVRVVSLLSIYALVLTAGGAEQAAQAALEASDEESP